jgi:hypothetical protein
MATVESAPTSSRDADLPEDPLLAAVPDASMADGGSADG